VAQGEGPEFKLQYQKKKKRKKILKVYRRKNTLHTFKSKNGDQLRIRRKKKEKEDNKTEE
jgi:hypothetical protein